MLCYKVFYLVPHAWESKLITKIQQLFCWSFEEKNPKYTNWTVCADHTKDSWYVHADLFPAVSLLMW